MITTNFNPYAARAYNMPNARQKQNNVAFERDLSSKELKGVLDQEEEIVNDVILFTGMTHIKKADLSEYTRKTLEVHREINVCAKYVLEVLDKHAAKK